MFITLPQQIICSSPMFLASRVYLIIAMHTQTRANRTRIQFTCATHISHSNTHAQTNYSACIVAFVAVRRHPSRIVCTRRNRGGACVCVYMYVICGLAHSTHRRSSRLRITSISEHARNYAARYARYQVAHCGRSRVCVCVCFRVCVFAAR